MYKVNGNDKVIPLTDIPQSSIGAPIPVIVSGEHDLLIAFYLQDTSDDWTGETVKVMGKDSANEPVCIVHFQNCYAHIFGPPNDEAFSGHPLSDKGLEPFGSYEVKNSSWLQDLEVMNSVHPYHDKTRFLERKRHIVLTFHDTTFECIAESYKYNIATGSVGGMVASMGTKLS